MHIPSHEEWNFRNLTDERRAYLDGDLTFDAIVALLGAEADVIEAEIRPYETTKDLVEKTARQIVFRIRVGKVCDLFFNSRDGLRGRYWQNPATGIAADRQILGALAPKLVEFALRKPPHVTSKKAADMSVDDIRRSLDAPSSKIWPLEREGMPVGAEVLSVPRWETNELEKQTRWRWMPEDRDLEVKGALIDLHGTEHLPASKRDRAQQIHLYGFT